MNSAALDELVELVQLCLTRNPPKILIWNPYYHLVVVRQDLQKFNICQYTLKLAKSQISDLNPEF